MSFNHYAKIKLILETSETGWYVRQINEPTSAKTFKGETKHFDHYYRIYDNNDRPIPYCKFQQIELFARIMNCNVEDVEIR